jgi:hypothetical protein
MKDPQNRVHLSTYGSEEKDGVVGVQDGAEFFLADREGR